MENNESYMENENKVVHKLIKNQKCKFDNSIKETAVILAAGHGKRIKSHTSKMLHKIWESLQWRELQMLVGMV